METRASTGGALPNLDSVVIDSMLAQTAVLDADGVIIRVNQAWVAFARENGREVVDDVGRPYLAACVGDGDEAAAGIADVLAGRLPGYELEYPCHGPDGKRWFVMRVVPLIGVPGAVVSHHDVTRPRLAEEALAQRNRELEQFAYVASHDLQEPLRMVSSFVDLIGERYGDRLDERGRAYVSFAVDGARRMQRLVQDVLEYAELSQHPVTRHRVDLVGVAANAIAELRLAEEAPAATVTVGDLPVLQGDEVLLMRVFRNLVSNAVKFAREDHPAVVRLDARRGHEEWVLSVEDEGIGIPDRFVERVFRMFARLQPRDRFPGSGIGLAICQQAVAAHGGRIWVEQPESGVGTRICFTIPDHPTAPGLHP